LSALFSKKQSNSFCDIIKGQSSSTCGPGEIFTSFLGNYIFSSPDGKLKTINHWQKHMWRYCKVDEKLVTAKANQQCKLPSSVTQMLMRW